MQIPVFNEKAVEALRSPDDLEKAIHVPAPGVWMIVAACAALMAALLSWGIFGTVSTGMDVTGIVKEGKILCLIDPEEAEDIAVGNTYELEGSNVTVESVSDIPMSRSEAKALLKSEYLVDVNTDDNWGRLVTFAPADTERFEEGSCVSFHITGRHVPPLSLILGGFER